MSELIFKIAIYLELDNISGYMKLKSVLLLNPICILYIIVCLYMLFYVQSIQIKYV